MDEALVLRLRCSEDVERPGIPHKHFAIDLRTPLPFVTLASLRPLIGTCACGRPMVFVWGDAPDPWDRTVVVP